MTELQVPERGFVQKTEGCGGRREEKEGRHLDSVSETAEVVNLGPHWSARTGEEVVLFPTMGGGFPGVL